MTAAVRRRKHDLAAPASRFIGRADDLAALARLFAEGRRLVTLWGPAGMGKTRLSLEVARAFAEAHPDEPVRFCEVDVARDLRAFCGAVARAIGVTVAAGKKDAGTIDRIGGALTAQGPMLVVLDNLEQVVEAAAPAIGAWVRAAPEARFLLTSRERTRLAGEISYELRPLGLPEEGGAASASEAVELFLDRAGAVSSARPMGVESLPKIATLVRRLEGIPLAIELAAARAELLGLDGLVARLEKRLDLLGGVHRGALARQATLRDAVAWSWDLLDEPDRRALARCAVFRGGFSLDAAHAVLEGTALDRVQSLRDKSLLRAVARAPGAPARFSLYEAVRELAEEKLAERGETAITVQRHAAHYLAIGESAAEDWARTGSVEALDRIGDDLENLRVVVERALARPAVEEALRALLVIDPVLSTRGPFGIHLELLDRALALAADPPSSSEVRADPLLEARALAARGRARQLRGSDAAGLDDLGQARARAALLGATTTEALIATEIGVIHHRRREMERARACYEEALAILRLGGDRRAEGRVLGNLGALHHDDRRFDEAARHYQPALAIAASVGDLRMEGLFSMNVGLLEQERGEAAEARRRYERAVTVLEEVGDLRLLGISLGNLGLLCHEEGRLDEARGHHARAAALLREGGDRRSEARAEGRLGAALASLDHIDEARAALARGDRLLAHLDDPLDAELLAVARGFLELALARSARVAGRAGEATSYLDEARGRIARARDGAPSLADRQDDIRLFLRILERGLSAMDGERGTGTDELLLSPEARFIRPPGGDWQDLRERHAVRRILLRLVARRRDAPGRGVSLLDLQEAGWPGERMLPQAASNRIYVAMNQLRKMGLKDCLRHGGEGYYLDPSLPVHHSAVEPILRSGPAG